MADREINLKFTSDAKPAKKGAKEIKKSVDDIGKSKGIKEVNKDLDQTKKKAKEASAEVGRVPKGQGSIRPLKDSQEVKDFKASYKSISNETRGLSASYTLLAEQIKDNGRRDAFLTNWEHMAANYGDGVDAQLLREQILLTDEIRDAYAALIAQTEADIVV